MSRVEVDVDAFLRDTVGESGNRSRNDPNVRQNYRDAGHSSVNMAATSFGQPRPDVRDIAEQVDQAVPHGHEFAPTGDGTGDKAQREGKIETFEASETVGPLDESAWEKYKNKLGEMESGNDYSAVNTIGFVGRWQFGAAALSDLGYVKKGSSTRGLKRKSSWTGKKGISTRDAFLGNTAAQDESILIYTRRNYKSLIRLNVITRQSPPDEVAGYLAAAHLKGPGGAQKLKNGIDNKDAYGTKASSYYETMKAELNGSTPADGSTPEEFVSKNTQPDAAMFAFPSSHAAPEYPYNSITEYEAGHFKEYDSTPGNERIQERHRTGTGYEVAADGSKRTIVSGDNYTAVMGSDYILVNGTCQIVVNGDCGLRVNGNLNHSVSNDYNLHVGGRMNVTVGADKYEMIHGSSAQTIEGDSAINVQGFQAVGVDGDMFSESASLSHVSKDGNVNLGATKSVNVTSLEDVNVNSAASINQTAKSEINSSSGEATNVTSGSDLMLASTGGKSTLHGSSETVVHSGGRVALDGSSITASPMVDRALYARYSGIASSLGSTSEPAEQGSSGAGGSGSKQTAGQKNTTESRVKNALELFTPFDQTVSQGHGGGQGTLHGYDKGFDYDAVEA